LKKGLGVLKQHPLFSGAPKKSTGLVGSAQPILKGSYLYFSVALCILFMVSDGHWWIVNFVTITQENPIVWARAGREEFDGKHQDCMTFL
jgi:hypothetical protein